MIQRRELSMEVERKTTIGNAHEQHTAGLQYAKPRFDCADWVFKVLEYVTSDHEVLAGVLDAGERYGIVDDIRSLHRVSWKLFCNSFGRRKIYVSNVGVWRDR